jgi:hypothetical protein
MVQASEDFPTSARGHEQFLRFFYSSVNVRRSVIPMGYEFTGSGSKESVLIQSLDDRAKAAQI